MKRRRFALFCSIGLILVLVASLVLAACAPAAPTPGAPTRITPQVPEQKQQAPVTVTPTVPKAAKPAPAPSAEIFEWKFQDNVPVGPGAHWQVGLWFNDWVENHSNGRLVITQYPALLTNAAVALDSCPLKRDFGIVGNEGENL